MSADFIKLISDLHSERFNVHLGELVTKKTPVGIFFGFNVIPSNVVANVKTLVNTGFNLTCVVVIADRVADVLKNFVDVPVVALEDISSFGAENFPVKPQEIFIMGYLIDLSFAPYFIRHGIEVLALFNENEKGTYFNSVIKNLPEIYAVHESLIDEESKKVFRASIKGQLTGKISDFRFAPEPQYFLDGFLPTTGDIAIDGGAYDGATAASFVKLGAKVFAFEMDANNYRNCLPRANEFAFTIEDLGLSDKAGEENYSSSGTGSSKNPEGDMRGQFIDLDTYVEQKNLPRVDYIKLDIEGAELDMLHGAAKTIKHFKPKMAVSAYHKPGDLWTLATYIKSLRPDYEFAFRHYRIDCTDYMLDDEQRAILKYFGLSWLMPSPCEMILYCR